MMHGEGKVAAHPGDVIVADGGHDERVLMTASGALVVGKLHDGHVRAGGRLERGGVKDLGGLLRLGRGGQSGKSEQGGEREDPGSKHGS